MKIKETIEYVRNEIKGIPNIEKKPNGGIRSFSSRIGYALSLGFKEKEIFIFGLLQWVCIGFGYLLWVQMLDWIPEEVWRSAAERRGGSIADVVLFAWSFLCVGITAFPIGILTGCMGAAHFLRKQNKESTIASCLRLVLPQSWALWIFHWIDGWITVGQILERLPSKGRRRTYAQRVLSEALYYAWKLGVTGVLPSILTGNNLLKSAKNSVVFVKENFLDVAKIRTGYSILCWIVGISAYIGTIVLFCFVDLLPEGDELYSHIYTFYLWAAVPILVAVGMVILFLRPIFILVMCDMYSDYLIKKGTDVNLPENPPKSVSAMVVFLCICILLAACYMYRYELGIMDMLATPYGQEYYP